MPGRNWGTELFARSMRRLFVESGQHSHTWLREQVEKATIYHPSQSKVDVQKHELSGVACDLIRPVKAQNIDTVIVYFHGGGYVFGSPASYRATLCQLAVNSNCLVVAPDYRLAPEHSFPAPQEDCQVVVRAVLKAYPEQRILLAGDSAGGALALQSALALSTGSELAKGSDDLAKGSDLKRINGLVLISPWVDPMASGGSINEHRDNDILFAQFLKKSFMALMKDADPDDPRVCIHNADLSALPPTLIHCGGGELFYDQIQEFYQKAKVSGVPVTLHNYVGQIHVFPVFAAVLKDGKRAMQQIADFVELV